jgi:hypothetical protein
MVDWVEQIRAGGPVQLWSWVEVRMQSATSTARDLTQFLAVDT